MALLDTILGFLGNNAGPLIGAGASILGAGIGAGAQREGISTAADLAAADASLRAAILKAEREEAIANRNLVREIAESERGEARAQRGTLLDIINAIRAEEAPFKEAALRRTQFADEFLPTIRERVARPQLSEGFKIASREGIDLLRKSFARTGSPSSGPAQIAAGRFLSDLAGRELDRFNENLFRAAGFATGLPQSQATGLVPGLTNPLPSANSGGFGSVPSALPPASQQPNFALTSGILGGNLASSIGNTVAQIPTAISLQNFLARS